MKPIHRYLVIPSLPPVLEPLRKIAYNLRWSWDHDTIELFRRLDRDLWESSVHNPVRMLGEVSQATLEQAAHNQAFLAHMKRVAAELDQYLNDPNSWYRRTLAQFTDCTVAYFSAEFGLTECLSIFAGGLGILAGDHLKSASDLGLNLTGVGLLYQQGYFRQYLNEAGWQQERYIDNDFQNLPLIPVRRPDGAQLRVSVDLAGRAVHAQIWRVDVGRVALYLLDTNIPDNERAEERDITDQLYGGDQEMRLKQEILLGIGGYRALEALGLKPVVYHMNEGHSAFLSLEHTRRLMETYQLNFEEARLLAQSSLVFTGHTPVMAGHDFFAPELMDRYFASYYPSLGLSRQEFLALGRQNPGDEREPFCMTVLALRMSAFRNGVSKLHGEVSRRMWQGLWPKVPLNEIPIGHVTNGVHFRSWISYEMNQLYDRYLGPEWREEPFHEGLWARAESIPPEELWRTHERRRERLVAFARRRLAEQLKARGAGPAEIASAAEALDPDALTIGFARRFAAYKRATLLLRDPARLARLLNQPGRPVQVIFAGKAHPRDEQGKELIRQIVALARSSEFRRRIVFLEEYDLAVARYLVQGCDVWLNNPRRPMEASGTSGMKAAANGALNLSTLDGWWDEAWSDCRTSQAGWAIGRGEVYASADEQDAVEAEALYDLLEREVIPAFYDRGPDRLPRGWIARMTTSLSCLCPKYNTHRMVRQYTEDFYVIAYDRFLALAADNAARARSLAAWLSRLRQAWSEVRVESIENHTPDTLTVGQAAKARIRVRLGQLDPQDVIVELYEGRVDPEGEIVDAVPVAMEPVQPAGPGVHIYEAASRPAAASGLRGFTVRVLPYHPDLPDPLFPGLIVWAE